MTATVALENNGWQVAVPQGQNHDEGLVQIQEKSTVDGRNEVGLVQPKEDDRVSTKILKRLDESRILAKDDKLLLAAHLLHGIDEARLEPVHHDILREAAIFKTILRDSTASLDRKNHGGWVKQGEHKGRHNFSLYYKLEDRHLSCRIENVVRSDLLVPILSVLNESELYQAWLPNWNVPRMKVVKSEKLRQSGRCGQVVNVVTEVPWPLAKRQVILKAVACDNIDNYSELENVEKYDCLGRDGGKILIRIQSMDCDNNLEEGLNIPPVEKGVARMKVRGGFTLRKCPSNNPMLASMLKYDATRANRGSPSREDFILFTFSFRVDPQLAVIPKSFVNFFIRTAMGQMWNMFLNVAEDIKDGKRPEHSKAIEEKREVLYDWVEERTRIMLRRVPQPPT